MTPVADSALDGSVASHVWSTLAAISTISIGAYVYHVEGLTSLLKLT